MIEKLVYSDSLDGVFNKASGDQVNDFLGVFAPVLGGELDFDKDSHLGDDLLVVIFVIEGESATEHVIEDDAQAPDVNLFAVGLADEHLGSDEGQSAEAVRYFFVGAHDLAQSEVHDLHHASVRGFSQHNVLWLQVAVQHAVLVQILYATGHLHHYLGCSFLWHVEFGLI